MSLHDYMIEWRRRLRAHVYFSWFYPTYIGDYVRHVHFRCALRAILEDGMPKQILDIGCGSGSYAYEVARKFPSVVMKGIDLDVTSAKSKQSRISNLSFERVDVIRLNIIDCYDVMYAIDVIDDIREWKLALRNAYFALKKRGFLYIHFPIDPRPLSVFKAKSITEYFRREASISVAKCSPDDLRTALKSMGFQIMNERITFGKPAVLAQEVNLFMMLRKGLLWKVFGCIIHPFLKLIAKSDLSFLNRSGNGVAILCRKI